MRIKSAVFTTSLFKAAERVRFSATPQIAVVGKSNSGKSSFINMLTGNGKLARASKDAGKTRALNFFEINGGEFYLVDMPGYGYSAAGAAGTAAFSALAEEYIRDAENLRHVFILSDIRRDPSEDDALLTRFLYSRNRPFTVFLSKADKLSKTRVGARRVEAANALNLGRDDVIPVSSVTGEGRDAALAVIQKALSL